MISTAVRRLRDVRMADAAEVGGKAASLGELLAAGVRVPDGVVLTTAAAGMTSDERGWLLGTGARELGTGPFAVRSSGIAEDGAEQSYAGMYESVLDVSADDLPAATDRCLGQRPGGPRRQVRAWRRRPDGGHHPEDDRAGRGRCRPHRRSDQWGSPRRRRHRGAWHRRAAGIRRRHR